MDAAGLQALRHDLKNVLTALKSGCVLIELEARPERSSKLFEVLGEMRSELDKGTELVARLRDVEGLLDGRG